MSRSSRYSGFNANSGMEVTARVMASPSNNVLRSGIMSVKVSVLNTACNTTQKKYGTA